MIGLLLDILAIDRMHGDGRHIDIAKGINEIPGSFKQAKDQIKRKKAWSRRR